MLSPLRYESTVLNQKVDPIQDKVVPVVLPNDKRRKMGKDDKDKAKSKPDGAVSGGAGAKNVDTEEPNMDEDITKPGPHDVLLGRGGGTNNHAGNVKFRQLVNQHKVRYLECSKVDKPSVARDVVQKWRKLDPPGRFLARKGETKKGPGSVKDANNIWYEVGDKKAREKASQCLREKTPDVLPYIRTLRQQQDHLTEQGVALVQQQMQSHQDNETNNNDNIARPKSSNHPGAASFSRHNNGVNPTKERSQQQQLDMSARRGSLPPMSAAAAAAACAAAGPTGPSGVGYAYSNNMLRRTSMPAPGVAAQNLQMQHLMSQQELVEPLGYSNHSIGNVSANGYPLEHQYLLQQMYGNFDNLAQPNLIIMNRIHHNQAQLNLQAQAASFSGGVDTTMPHRPPVPTTTTTRQGDDLEPIPYQERLGRARADVVPDTHTSTVQLAQSFEQKARIHHHETELQSPVLADRVGSSIGLNQVLAANKDSLKPIPLPVYQGQARTLATQQATQQRRNQNNSQERAPVPAPAPAPSYQRVSATATNNNNNNDNNSNDNVVSNYSGHSQYRTFDEVVAFDDDDGSEVSLVEGVDTGAFIRQTLEDSNASVQSPKGETTRRRGMLASQSSKQSLMSTGTSYMSMGFSDFGSIDESMREAKMGMARSMASNQSIMSELTDISQGAGMECLAEG